VGDRQDSCQEPDCRRRVYARGWCGMHYKRWLRTGSPVRGERPKRCAVDGCDRAAESRGWCHAHYQRWRRHGDPIAGGPIRRSRVCDVDACERSTHARGLCAAHYQRLRRFDDTLAELPIGRMTRGGPVSAARPAGWRTEGYRYVPVPVEERHLTGGSAYEAEHRLVMARHLGRRLATDETVHHRNGDRHDNRISNLELWSTAQPSGQRVSDKIIFALEILDRYAPETRSMGTTDRAP
jgi:hypothetical protein